MVLMACCTCKVGEYAASLSDAEATIKLAPQWNKGFFRMAEVLATTGHFERAAAVYVQRTRTTLETLQILQTRQGREHTICLHLPPFPFRHQPSFFILHARPICHCVVTTQNASTAKEPHAAGVTIPP